MALAMHLDVASISSAWPLGSWIWNLDFSEFFHPKLFACCILHKFASSVEQLNLQFSASEIFD